MVDKERFYIFDQLDHEAGREFKKDYQTPAPFANKDLYTKDFPLNYGSHWWFVMGPKHSGDAPVAVK